jgi:parvulin-like peptidyl-prolyl isomerase
MRIGLVCLLAAGSVSAQQRERERPVRREVPWRPTQAAGQLTEPGSSRLLPAPDDVGAASPMRRTPAPNDAEEPQHRVAAVPSDAQSADAWWKHDAEETVVDPERGYRSKGVSPRGEIIQSSQILAMVGSEPILAGDLLARINELLKEAEGQVPAEELDKQRWLLMERMLPAAIEAKLVFLDFKRRLEKEQIDGIRSSVYQQFDEKQLPLMVDNAKLTSASELDAKIRALGGSLDSVRLAFFEQVAAREMIRKQGEDESEVTHDELLAYYQEHEDEFQVKARARWEHLMVKYSEYPSKRAAYKALADLGNSVLRGAPFDVVARQGSQGPRAEQGGLYDWTTRGSLASKVLDDAIFSLPVGHMSDILADDHGFHIVRVVERQDAGRVPFRDAQAGIRDKIQEARRDEKVKSYLERLKRETYVWNHFDSEERIATRPQPGVNGSGQ